MTAQRVVLTGIDIYSVSTESVWDLETSAPSHEKAYVLAMALAQNLKVPFHLVTSAGTGTEEVIWVPDNELNLGRARIVNEIADRMNAELSKIPQQDWNQAKIVNTLRSYTKQEGNNK